MLAMVFALPSCKSNRWEIDVSHIEVDVPIIRFDKKLMEIPEEGFTERAIELQQTHPEIYDFFTDFILQMPFLNDSMKVIRLNQYVYHPYQQKLHNDAREQYDDFDDVQEEISNAFRHVRYYFPTDTFPTLFTLNTSMTYQVVTLDNLLGISPDMFLGSDYRFYPARDYFGYQMTRFRREYIAPQVMKGYFNMRFPEDDLTTNRFLSEMIHKGKRLFFLDVVMPGLHDSLRLEYTYDQLKWARNNEGMIWKYFVKEDLLFNTQFERKDRFFRDGPFTNAPGVPQESSPRIGEFIGLQIVRKYMKENPEVTPDELFNETNYEKILRGARYKPRG